MNPMQEALMEVKIGLDRQLKEYKAKWNLLTEFERGYVRSLEDTIQTLNVKMVEAQS